MACGIGGTVFFSLRSTQPPVIVEQVSVAAHDDGSPAASEDADQLTLRQLKRSGAKPKSVLLYAGVLPLLAVFIVFNMSFTSFDVSITATMKSMGLEPSSVCNWRCSRSARASARWCSALANSKAPIGRIW